MPWHRWSIARLMVITAIFSVSLAALLALRPEPANNDPGIGVLALFMALILTTAADRALFGSKSRAFWIGFTATGWLCAAVALIDLHGTRGYILRHGPPLVRARQVFIERHIAAEQARMRGINVVPPPMSEWHLLASLLTETGLGFAVGLLAASAGGLATFSLAAIARRLDPTSVRLHRNGLRQNAEPGG